MHFTYRGNNYEKSQPCSLGDVPHPRIYNPPRNGSVSTDKLCALPYAYTYTPLRIYMR